MDGRRRTGRADHGAADHGSCREADTSSFDDVVLGVVVAGVSALSFTEAGPGHGATVPYLIFVVLVGCAMQFGIRVAA